MITQMLFTLFCTVAFCLGFYLVTQEGYILDFIREYFEAISNKVELLKSIRRTGSDIIPVHTFNIWFMYYRPMLFISTPFIMCITCMGSLWGATWFIILNGISLQLMPYLIINCFAAAFIQTFIWKLYARYIL